MPEFMLSSDASNANYASTMVAETPAVRMFERLQAQQVEDDRAVFCRVIRNACEAGTSPEAVATDGESIRAAGVSSRCCQDRRRF